MVKFASSSPSNWGRFHDPVVDQLFEQQKVERDAQKRAQLVKDMQKRIARAMTHIRPHQRCTSTLAFPRLRRGLPVGPISGGLIALEWLANRGPGTVPYDS